jgi:hypothetical protein
VPPAVVAESRKGETPKAAVDKKRPETAAPKPVENVAPPAMEPAPVPAAPDAKSDKGGAGGSWFSISSTPWDANAQQPTHPAPSWDAPPTPAPSQPAEASFPPVPEQMYVAEPGVNASAPELEPEPAATGFYTDSAPLPELVAGGQDIAPATVETLRQEATQVVEESVVQRLEEPSPVSSQKPEAAAPNVDDLVAKVLAKMNPDVLQAVTREILKPVVEAMVREEMKSKKS